MCTTQAIARKKDLMPAGILRHLDRFFANRRRGLAILMTVARKVDDSLIVLIFKQSLNKLQIFRVSSLATHCCLIIFSSFKKYIYEIELGARNVSVRLQSRSTAIADP